MTTMMDLLITFRSFRAKTTTKINNSINLSLLRNLIAMEQLAAEQRKVNKKKKTRNQNQVLRSETE
ncbi:MAG: hypothetical protein C4539_17210 [Ignavibacteriales bacterium]|nr:MAG: hypothetical protein C4539_17210 [Ignavibacteriales bacterium]